MTVDHSNDYEAVKQAAVDTKEAFSITKPLGSDLAVSRFEKLLGECALKTAIYTSPIFGAMECLASAINLALSANICKQEDLVQIWCTDAFRERATSSPSNAASFDNKKMALLLDMWAEDNGRKEEVGMGMAEYTRANVRVQLQCFNLQSPPEKTAWVFRESSQASVEDQC